ncbi:hypothetical protein EYF80_062619 [Liparis tanakae]|uniref:Uncharacterized protein n=1 Tax=Liparis tanakae TaxID=230148 RepID=A0A4Z2EEF6_9TELE|nr:hypothetical protein EYF80_062619 [Liparis tanakae]
MLAGRWLCDAFKYHLSVQTQAAALASDNVWNDVPSGFQDQLLSICITRAAKKSREWRRGGGEEEAARRRGGGEEARRRRRRRRRRGGGEEARKRRRRGGVHATLQSGCWKHSPTLTHDSGSLSLVCCEQLHQTLAHLVGHRIVSMTTGIIGPVSSAGSKPVIISETCCILIGP